MTRVGTPTVQPRNTLFRSPSRHGDMDRKTKLRIWRNRGAFALLIGIAGVGTYTRFTGSASAADPSPWAAGTAATYRLDWQMDTEVAVDGQALPLAGHV